MLAFLPSPVLLVLNCILIALNCIVIATPIMLLGIIRMLLPIKAVNFAIETLNFHLYRCWVFNNRWIIALTNDIKWHISGDSVPNTHKSCFIISNHLSWADILFIGCVYRGNIPVTKFFMKQNLIYIPFVGLACYALGMPFLHRYGKDKLLKKPKLRKKDIKSTKAACRRLIEFPSTLINFVEGSRYTPAKAKKARSPYQNLLPPKTTSLGVAMGEIGNEIEYFFNNTFYYPDNKKKAFIDLLKGRVKNVYVNVQIMPKDSLPIGNYLEDKEYKQRFTKRIKELWAQKDAVLESMKEDYKQLKNSKQQ